MHTLTDTEPDPQDCPDCVLYGEPCPYHQGLADGWDLAAAVVGALVLDQQGGDPCR